MLKFINTALALTCMTAGRSRVHVRDGERNKLHLAYALSETREIEQTVGVHQRHVFTRMDHGVLFVPLPSFACGDLDWAFKIRNCLFQKEVRDVGINARRFVAFNIGKIIKSGTSFILRGGVDKRFSRYRRVWKRELT